MRRRLLLALIVLIGACFLVIFIPTLFKKQVADILRNRMNEGIYGDVSFSNADINLWQNFPQFTFTFNDFVISGRKQFRGDTLIATREFHVVLSTIPLLFSQQAEIRTLSLIDPHIHVAIHNDGKTNYDIFHAADSVSADESENVKLEIDSWTIENGTFFYDDHENNLTLRGDGLFLTGNGDVSGNLIELAIVAATSNFTANYEKENYVTDKDITLDLKFSFDMKNNLLKFSENRIQVNNLALTTSGTYQLRPGSHYFDLKFASDDSDFRNLVTLSKYFSGDLKKLDVKGHFVLDGFIKGTLDEQRDLVPSFCTNLKVTDGFIKFQGLPSSLNEINFDLTASNADSVWTNTVIDLPKFNVNFGTNPFAGYLLIKGLQNSYVKSDITAKINLEDLKKIYPMEGISMTGTLDVDLKANGTYHQIKNQKKSDWLETLIPPFSLDVHVSDGTFKYDHLPESISGVNFHMTGRNTKGKFEHTSLKIEKLEGRLGDNPVSGFINIDGFRDPFIRSELKANINLADIKNFFPLDDINLKGLFDMDLKVDGQLSDSLKKFPRVNTKINLANGFIQSDRYPAPMENTHLVLEALNETGELKDTRLTIDTLTYAIENETFFIEGQVRDLEKYAYDLSVNGVIYLDKVKKIFAIDDIEMAGEVDIDFKTAGTLKDLKDKRYHRLPTAGHLQLKNVTLQNSNVPHGLTFHEGKFLFTNEKIFVLDTLHGSVGLSNFSLTGHLFNYLAYVFHSNEKIKGNLRVESEYFNLDEVLGSEKVSAKDTTWHLHVVKVPDNIDFVFDADIASLVYKGLEVDNLKGEITMRDGILTLGETSFQALDADFKFSGDYDTRDLAHPLFDVKVNVHNLDITKAHDAFVTVQAIAPASEHTYGVISVDYALKGELMRNLHPSFESLEGGGTVRISDAKINGMKLFHHVSGITKKEELMNPELKDIVMETTVKEGTVYVKPFTMKLAGFQTDIEGKHDLSGTMNYILKIALPPFEIVKIPLHVNGTYDNPKVHLGKGHEETRETSPAGSSE